MSIQSEIERISGNIADAYTACSDKGATIPENPNSDNLADTITSIPAGGSAEVRGSWVVPPLYLEIDAATDDTTNEVYQKCLEYVQGASGRKINAVVGFTLPVGYYNITIKFSSSSKRPDAVLVSDGRKIYSSVIDSENGYSTDYTFEFNNLDGSKYLIFYYIRSTQCWNFSGSSSASVYIDSSAKSDIGGCAKYVVIKPNPSVNSSYLIQWGFNSSYYLESFKIIGELNQGCKKTSMSSAELICSYSSLKYWPPLSQWCTTDVCSWSGNYDFRKAYELTVPYGLDLSQYSGSAGTVYFGPANASTMPHRMQEFYVKLPAVNIEFQGIWLTQDNWNYLAENAPVVSGKTITLVGCYIGSSATFANPTAAILGEAYTTFINKGWSISGLKT